MSDETDILTFEYLNYDPKVWSSYFDISELFHKNASPEKNFKLLEGKIMSIEKQNKKQSLYERLSFFYNLLSLKSLNSLTNEFHSFLAEFLAGLQNSLKLALQEQVVQLKARIGVFESFAQQRLRSGILFEHITEKAFIEELENLQDAPSEQMSMLAKGFDEVLRGKINACVEEYKRCSVNLDDVLHQIHLLKDVLLLSFHFGVNLLTSNAVQDLGSVHHVLLSILDTFDGSLLALDNRMEEVKALTRKLSGGGGGSSIVFPVLVPNLVTLNQKPTIMAHKGELILILGAYKVYMDKMVVMKTIWCSSLKSCFEFVFAFAYYFEPEKIPQSDHVKTYNSVMTKQKKSDYFHQLHHEMNTRHFLVLLPHGASMALKLPENDAVQLQSVMDKIAVLRPEYRRMDLCLKFENGSPLDDKILLPLSALGKDKVVCHVTPSSARTNADRRVSESARDHNKSASVVEQQPSPPQQPTSEQQQPTEKEKESRDEKGGEKEKGEKDTPRSPADDAIKRRRSSKNTLTSSVGKTSSLGKSSGGSSGSSTPSASKSRKRLPSANEAAATLTSPGREREQPATTTSDVEQQDQRISPDSVGMALAPSSASQSVPSSPTSIPTSPIVSPRDSLTKSSHDPTARASDTLDDIPLEQAEELLTLIRRPSQQRKVFRNFDRNYSTKKNFADGADGESGAMSPSTSVSSLNASGRSAGDKSGVRAHRTNSNSPQPSSELQSSGGGGSPGSSSVPNSPSQSQSLSLASSQHSSTDKRSGKEKKGQQQLEGMPLNFSNLFMQLDAEPEQTDSDPSLASLFDAASIGLAYDSLHNVKRGGFARSYTDAPTHDDSDLLNRLHSLKDLPPIPLIPHVEKERLESLMREKRKDEKANTPRAKHAPHTPRASQSLTVAFNTSKEKKDYISFLESLKARYGLSNDGDALLVLESSLEWLAVDKAHGVALRRRLFCSELGETTHAHLHAHKTPIPAGLVYFILPNYSKVIVEIKTQSSTISDLFPKTDLNKIIQKSEKENIFLDRKGNVVSDDTAVASLPGRVVFLKGDKSDRASESESDESESVDASAHHSNKESRDRRAERERERAEQKSPREQQRSPRMRSVIAETRASVTIANSAQSPSSKLVTEAATNSNPPTVLVKPPNDSSSSHATIETDSSVSPNASHSHSGTPISSTSTTPAPRDRKKSKNHSLASSHSSVSDVVSDSKLEREKEKLIDLSLSVGMATNNNSSNSERPALADSQSAQTSQGMALPKQTKRSVKQLPSSKPAKDRLKTNYPEDTDLLTELAQRSAQSLKNAKRQGYALCWVNAEWRKMYLVLDGEQVYLFADEAGRKPKHVLFLRRFSVSAAPESAKKNCFKLFDVNFKDQQPYVFACLSSREADDWIDAIKDVMLSMSNVRAKYGSVESLRTETTVYLKIIEVKFFVEADEKRDVFCTIYGDSTALVRTATVFQSERPLFIEEFEFDGEKFNSFSVMVYEQRNRKEKPHSSKAMIQVDDFLMAIDSHEMELKIEDIWYKLYATSQGHEERRVNQNTEHPVGEIRMAFERKIATILPDKEYNSMLMLLMEDDLELVKRMSVVSSQQEKQVAETLVRAFDVRRASVFLIITLLKHEITSTQRGQILFRQNTVATKALDTYLRLTGMAYLHHCLKSIVAHISFSAAQEPGSKYFRSCELDAHRIDEKDEKKKRKMIERNYVTLILYCDQVLDAIRNAFRYCPTSFRNIFTQLQAFVISQESLGENSRYTAVSGLIWLRFFCIALCQPKMYGLTEEQPSVALLRELTLVGKTLQNLANMVEFGKKEEFMIIVNPWLNKRKQDMKDFIDKLCSLPTEPVDEVPVKQDPLTWGREMSKVHVHLKDALPRLIAQYGAEDKLNTRLSAILDYYDVGQKL